MVFSKYKSLYIHKSEIIHIPISHNSNTLLPVRRIAEDKSKFRNRERERFESDDWESKLNAETVLHGPYISLL